MALNTTQLLNKVSAFRQKLGAGKQDFFGGFSALYDAVKPGGSKFSSAMGLAKSRFFSDAAKPLTYTAMGLGLGGIGIAGYAAWPSGNSNRSKINASLRSNRLY